MVSNVTLSNQFTTLTGHQQDSNDQSHQFEAGQSSVFSKIISQVTTPSRGLLKLHSLINGAPAIILVDCGATGEFISSSFVTEHSLKSSPLPRRDFVTLANGSQQEAGSIVESASVSIGSYTDAMSFVALPLVGYDAILGVSWLSKYNPSIDWRSKSLKFVDKSGQEHHLLAKAFPKARGAVHAVTRSVSAASPAAAGHSLSMISSRALKYQIRSNQIDPNSMCLVFPQQLKSAVPVESSLSSVNQGSSPETPRLDVVSKDIIREYRDVFPEELPPGLPPQREIDHKIELTPGSSPPSRPTYRMSAVELTELKKQLEELTRRASSNQ